MLYIAFGSKSLIPEGFIMQTATQAERRPGYAGLAVVALWGITFIGARLLLDKDLQLPTWAKVTAALAPVIPTALFLWCIVRAIGELDELHRRVHLEALAVAFPLAILMLMTLGLLQLAINLPAEDWSYRHVWIYLPMFYFLGYALAWRRYR
jgi:hypothetical protein